jgi:hypothetical protein
MVRLSTTYLAPLARHGVEILGAQILAFEGIFLFDFFGTILIRRENAIKEKKIDFHIPLNPINIHYLAQW